MFMLWAIPLGILIGLAAGGRPGNLSTFRFRWSWLAVGGLLAQVVLFSPTGDALASDAGPVIYVASTAAVLLAVLRNIRLPGMPLVALGAVANLAAITANGGFMPASAEALATAGLPPGDHLNSIVVASPALQPLTDIYAIPTSLPMANVFSVGDVLIAIGIAWTIAAAMRGPKAPATPRAPAELKT
jgi:uncharacterized protein DUF5317